MAALSQRRSETAPPAASSPPDQPRKGPLLSPGLLSGSSDKSGASAGSSGGEESPDDRDKELTDPFDELQAFFAGAPLSDGASDGRSAAASKVGADFSGVLPARVFY